MVCSVRGSNTSQSLPQQGANGGSHLSVIETPSLQRAPEAKTSWLTILSTDHFQFSKFNWKAIFRGIISVTSLHFRKLLQIQRWNDAVAFSGWAALLLWSCGKWVTCPFKSVLLSFGHRCLLCKWSLWFYSWKNIYRRHNGPTWILEWEKELWIRRIVVVVIFVPPVNMFTFWPITSH